MKTAPSKFIAALGDHANIVQDDLTRYDAADRGSPGEYHALRMLSESSRRLSQAAGNMASMMREAGDPI